MLYWLYKLGKFLCNALPLRVCYRMASAIANLKYLLPGKDKKIITNNLKVVLRGDDGEIQRCVRGVFRNFGKYLVDFFRQDRMNKENIKRFIKVRGIENLDRAFGKQKGVIIISAHLGNWELGAAVVAMLGYPLNIIALSHKDKKVNSFFNEKRKLKGIKIIPLGGAVKKCMKSLDGNEAIALVCDRDFSRSDLTAKFFGRDATMPKGVGILKLKRASDIIPCFMVREPDDTYTLNFDKPVEYNPAGGGAEDMKGIVEETAKAMEGYIKKYPDQWFMFDDLWGLAKS